jgi:ligand-binding sensor protein
MARRALSQWVIRDFLQNVFGMAAGAAFVSVNRHGETVDKTVNYRSCASFQVPESLWWLAWVL